MSDLSKKKYKRSFSEAWLNDDKCKSWIRKVPLNDSLFHCIICKKDFSCNTSITRHADSACHINNIKKSTPEVSNNDTPTENNTILKKNNYDIQTFRQQWLEIEQFQPWLREASHDKKLCFCSFCEKYIIAKLCHIYRHADSAKHSTIAKQKNEEKKGDENVTAINKSLLSYEEQKKVAEIKYAAFITEKSLPYQIAEQNITFFKKILKDCKMLQDMTMSRTKCQKIISNVLCPIETDRIVNIIQNTKFCIFIDETSDISNQKWMTFLVRYVEPKTLDTRAQLVKLINIDAKNSSAEKLFEAFNNEMLELQIPYSNIVALSSDNASVMLGKHLSFKKKLEEKCKKLLTLPCPCHSAALIAHTACSKIPQYCEEFVKKIANYISSSPKRSAIFEEFTECFQKKNCKILKLAETRWLSRHSCIERLIELWSTIELFLREIVMSEKTKSGEYLLSVMQNLDVKAYLLFLKYILNFFNSFNAFFQSNETRIQLLQPKSLQFLIIICKHFIKSNVLNNVNNNFDFCNKENQKSLHEINLGPECENYLNQIVIQGHTDVVVNVRENCLKFYITTAQDICKRLPINDKFLSKLKAFESETALRDVNRETSFNDVSSVAQTISEFDDNGLKKEWFALYHDITEIEKDNLARLNFDEMWKQIFQCSHQYPNLKSLLNAVRSMPNSNAEAERVFSILPDLKTKKRNKLSSASINASCVVKSALKARKEDAADITITKKHLSLMSTDKLYAANPRKRKSNLTLYAADENEITSPCSSTVG